MALLTDEAARIDALDVKRSFIVRSPAGSGKTQLLTLRFLALLCAVQKDPEEILAITFTRKAAAEMRERILQALLKAEDPLLSSDPLSLQTRELALQVLARDAKEHWHLLTNPNRLRIQTIDSFCAYLVKQMPISAHFSTYSEIIEDASFLYLQAARETLNEIDCQEDWSVASEIEQLLLHFDNAHEKIEKLLVAMLAKRDQWVGYLPQIEQGNRAQLEEGLSHIVQAHLSQLVTGFPSHYAAELVNLLRYAAGQVLLDDPLHIFLERDQLPGAAVENYSTWLAIADFLLTKEGQWRKTVTQQQGFPAKGNPLAKEMKAKMLELLTVLSTNELLRELLAELKWLPPLHYTDQQWLSVTAWLKVFPLLLAHLQLIFQRENVVDYVEIALNAVKALGEADAPSDLTLLLDQQIQHILVDEFQDTSVSQWRLLEKIIAGWQLGDGRTLFLVGDPMQSIYRFRKAKVGLFLKAAEQGIGSISLELLTLQMNFRSRANLVHWANNLFADLMPQVEDAQSGAIKFVTSIPSKSVEHDHVTVKWHPLFNADDERQAMQVVAIIQTIFAAEPEAKIAILVKARSHTQAILPLLAAANISYQAVELSQLTAHPVILDLLALTRAFLNPVDRIAWLSVLRAPWCGLLLADLYQIAGIETEKTIWEKISDIPVGLQDAKLGTEFTRDLNYFEPEKPKEYSLYFEDFPAQNNLKVDVKSDASVRILKSDRYITQLALSQEAQVRLDYFITVMKRNLSQKGSLSLRVTIEKIWRELNGPACLVSASEEQNISAFFAVLDELEVAGDILDIAELEQRLANRYATSIFTAASKAVEIMTIHKAKGLEFDHVIMLGLERKTAADEAQLLLWGECGANQKNYLILGPSKDTESKNDPIYRYLQHQEAEKSRHEMLRLFYVAVTRAKKSLHLIGSVNYQGESMKKPPLQSFLGQAWPNVEVIFQQALADNMVLQSIDKKAPKQIAHQLRRLKKSFLLDCHALRASNDGLTAGQHSQQKEDHSIKFVDRKQHLAQSVGTVIHQNFQYFNYDFQRAMKFEPTASRQALLELGVSIADIEQAVKLVECAIKNVSVCERGRWIFNPEHQDIHAEYPLSYLVQDRLVSCVIDRTFVDSFGIRWIIDFKTNITPIENMEAFLHREKQLHQAQLEHYASLMRKADNRPICLGLYFPLQRAWIEWEFVPTFVKAQSPP